MSTPDPGTPEAKEQGCTCPQEYNQQLDSDERFVINSQCPIHDTGITSVDEDDDVTANYKSPVVEDDDDG